ncbi:hypothetical protein BHE74_00055660, partial [Ensete ventricosum]
DTGVRGKATGSNYGGGPFYMAVSFFNCPACEPADFYNDRSATIDIPLDTAKDLRKKEKELQAKEAELNKKEKELKRREEAAARGNISASYSRHCFSYFLI